MSKHASEDLPLLENVSADTQTKMFVPPLRIPMRIVCVRHVWQRVGAVVPFDSSDVYVMWLVRQCVIYDIVVCLKKSLQDKWALRLHNIICNCSDFTLRYHE